MPKGVYVRTYSNSYKGHILPIEWRRNISKGLRRYYSEHIVWNRGIKHSEATKRKISVSCKQNGIGTWNRGRTKKKSAKKIAQGYY